MTPITLIDNLIERKVSVICEKVNTLSNLLLEVETEDVSQEQIVVSDIGLNFLQTKLADLNKKATRWKLPPLELKIIKEEDVRDPGANYVTKRYTISITGESPRVQGYEFIAKIEHTDAGNIINVSPDASVKNLPDEFRQADAECDVCHTRRERLNTFVLRKEVDNSLMKVGSGCLKRFLPAVSVNALINYAHMLEDLRQTIEEGDFDREDVGGGRSSMKYYDVKSLINVLALAFLAEGRYISKTKANVEMIPSTADFALAILRNNVTDQETRNKIESMRGKADELTDKILDWSKNYDFVGQGEDNPSMQNLFNNMQVLAHSETANIKNMGYLSALFGTYLRETNKAERLANAKPSEFVGTVGAKIEFEAKVYRVRTYNGQYGVGYIYALEDASGNKFVWFSSNDVGLVENETYKFKATVKNHQVSNYGGHKETIITRAKVTKLDGTKMNEVGV